MIELERTGDRSPFGDREMTRTVVPHQDELLVEIEGIADLSLFESE